MMRRTLFALGALLLLVSFLFPSSHAFAASSRAQMPAGGFAASCSNLFITSNDFLAADCRTENGVENYTTLDLDLYIGNYDGTFVTPGNDFAATCYGVGINGGSVLIADCARYNGTLNFTSIHLNAYITNVNGIMVWS